MRYEGPGTASTPDGNVLLEQVHVVVSDEGTSRFYTKRHAWHGTIKSQSSDLMPVFRGMERFELALPGMQAASARVVSFDQGGSRAQVVGDDPWINLPGDAD